MKRFFSSILLTYLRLAAKLQLLKNPGAIIIGITGSAGKTSTRLATYACLKDHFRVKMCSHGNSQTGIPLDILGLKINTYSFSDWTRIALLIPWQLLTNWERYQILIVEMGIDGPREPSNMTYLLKIIRPHIGVFLNVSSVHAAAFDSLITDGTDVRQLIASEKAKLITSLPKSGHAILNLDDPFVAQITHQTSAPTISFGKNPQSAIQIKNIGLSLKSGFTASYQLLATSYLPAQTGQIRFPHQILGLQYAHTFAAALAVSHALKLPINKAISSLQVNFQLPPSRMNLLPGIHQSHLIDSSYNSSPLSAQEAINTCKQLKSPHKIAILGDMREIGTTELDAHRQIASAALKVFDQVIFIGPIFQKSLLATSYLPRGKAGQLPATKFFNCALHAIHYIKSQIKDGSLILVKGSQNTIFLETIVEALLANPADKSQLCRQSPYWQKIKHNFFSTCTETIK